MRLEHGSPRRLVLQTDGRFSLVLTVSRGAAQTSPVLWEACVKSMSADGVAAFYETGPQKQLKSMMRRMNMDLFKKTQNIQV